MYFNAKCWKREILTDIFYVIYPNVKISVCKFVSTDFMWGSQPKSIKMSFDHETREPGVQNSFLCSTLFPPVQILYKVNYSLTLLGLHGILMGFAIKKKKNLFEILSSKGSKSHIFEYFLLTRSGFGMLTLFIKVYKQCFCGQSSGTNLRSSF